MPAEEVACQLQDVGATLPERGHADIDPAQPVIQVGTKQLTLDQRVQRSIGGRDNSRIDAARGVAAHSFDGQILDGAQQLGLRRQRKVRDLVEEQGAAVGVLELAAPAFHAGRGPFFDAEELRLEQRVDQRRAVDRHERAISPTTELVNLTRDKLLPDPTLSLERPVAEHRNIGVFAWTSPQINSDRVGGSAREKPKQGATWLPDDTIGFATNAPSAGLQRVSANGGTRAPSALSAAAATHTTPQAATLCTPPTGTLMAVAFNPGRLAMRGPAVSVVPRLGTTRGAGDFEVAC